MKTGSRLAQALTVLVPLAAASQAQAQEMRTIVLQGDVVPGIGKVALVDGMAVDDSGKVLVHVLTDEPDPDRNAAVLDGEGVVLAEGRPLREPFGARIRSFNGGVMDFGAAGAPVFSLSLSGPPDTAREGIYIGTGPEPAMLKSALSTAPELPVGSSYRLLLPARTNTRGALCFHAVVDDPNVDGSFDIDAIVTLDLATGVQAAPYQRGDVLPGQDQPILDFQWNAHGMAFNSSGSIFFGAETGGAEPGTRVLYIDQVKIAQAGEPSPFGPDYSSIATSSMSLDLNDRGEYAFACSVDALDAIVKNGMPFIRGGVTLPCIAPGVIDAIGQPLSLGNDGRLLWMGAWRSPTRDARAQGLFVDHELLVETGVTELGGQLVTKLDLLDQSGSISTNGRYVIFAAVLADGREGAFSIDLEG